MDVFATPPKPPSSRGELDLIRAGIDSARMAPAATPLSVTTNEADDEYYEVEVEEVTLYKPSKEASLGLRFRDPLSQGGYQLLKGEGAVRAIVEFLAEGGLAERVLNVGDEVVSINGEEVSGPSEGAATLRSLQGTMRLGVVRDALVDSEWGSPLQPSDGVYSGADEDGVLSDEETSPDAAREARAGAGAADDASHSSGDDERLATGDARGTTSHGGVRPTDMPFARGFDPVHGVSSLSVNSFRPSQPASPFAPTNTNSFRLELPLSPCAPQQTSPALKGVQGHLRLSAKGSGKQLLRVTKSSLKDHADGSLTARVRKLGAMLSPRA